MPEAATPSEQDQPNFLKRFAVHYERSWDDGAITQHVVEVDACGAEGARTIVIYKLDHPSDLRSERITEIKVITRAGTH